MTDISVEQKIWQRVDSAIIMANQTAKRVDDLPRWIQEERAEEFVTWGNLYTVTDSNCIKEVLGKVLVKHTNLNHGCVTTKSAGIVFIDRKGVTKSFCRPLPQPLLSLINICPKHIDICSLSIVSDLNIVVSM